ncbi:3-mercaptopyruvate sulfurtransferase [Dongia soli]|uniref:Sulfurtransferase n=1 Tax=Dongia soli TaxID=600628 RepID=A0ABU5EF49_9PROT|nr:3-mercaptopyruvate sulfurtransferase [Dongia soli]MDY0885029.1 3-mercaptopyruvate sulfurtransferase [Dongia soli]
MSMTYANPQSLVSTDWLAANLDQPDLRIVDATYYLPMQGKNARAAYLEQHIPGALFFDIDDIADTTSPLPHMLPPQEKFSARMRKLGIGDGNRVVVYDRTGLLGAARVWWMFRIFGKSDVAILDGGFPKWLAEDRPTEDGEPHLRERHLTARLDNTQVRSKDQLLRNLTTKREQVLDARAAGRFNATEPELWPGRRAGHIPGSFNLPYNQLLNPADGTMLPADQLKAKFAASGIDLARPVVTTCGSGITAAVLAFGLHLIGHRDVAVYDGSWAEWGLPGDTPVEPA